MALYVRHRSSFQHDTGPHPENADRLVAIESALADADWLGLERLEAPAATREQLLRVHSEEHVNAIEGLCSRGGGMIDLDTVAGEHSYRAALHAAGGAVHAVDRLVGDGVRDFAICGLRPPGHHAERGRAMGFCLFNNVAVAAAHAAEEHGAKRVVVVDWDVHHGNGTAAIFAGSSRVLYASIHQSPLYPGTGSVTEVGEGDGEGFTINMPVPPGSGPARFLSLIQHVVSPLISRLEPSLVAISAGYDAHAADPLAQCELDAGAYRDMAATLRRAAGAVDAPILVCLEGGYDLDALAESVVATIEGLGGSDGPPEAPRAEAEPYLSRFRAWWPDLGGT